MPSLTHRLPRYCHHKATGRAVVYLGGKARYLGAYNSPESRALYKSVVADWLDPESKSADDEPASAAARPATPTSLTLTLTQVICRYRKHAQAYYSESREADNLRDAIRPLRVLFGKMKPDDIRTSHLRQVRDAMVKSGLSRKLINARINRIRRMFRWAVTEDLCEPATLERLRALEALRRGRGGKERPAVRPVSWETVQATVEHMTDMGRSMVLVGWYSGARPGEITSLSTGIIDTSQDVWVAKFERHKCAYRGQTREVLFGPQAQAILTPWLLPSRPDEPIFSPKRIDRRKNKRKGRRKPGQTYGRSGLNCAIARACDRAGVTPWAANRLRHAAATRLRDKYGIEAAQVALGHARPDTTMIYTAEARERAIEAIRLAG
jgi:integrase